MEPSIAVVIVNWNGRQDTLETIESLRQNDYENFRMIVVDNGSTDGSLEALRPLDDVALVENGANLGMAKANNAGVRRALESRPDQILLLNNDVKVAPDMLAQLGAALERDPSVGIVAPKMYYYDEPDVLWFAGGSISRWKGDSSHDGMEERDAGQYDDEREVDYVSSCAMLGRREVFEQVGPEDPSFFIYFGETDYCVRARNLGWGVRYVPQAVLWHKVSRTMGSGSPNYWQQYTRSRVIFVRWNFGLRQKLAALAYILLWDTPRLLAHFARRRKLECVPAYFRGLGEGLRLERGEAR
jgi:GT2 family glycosyltransferase